MVKYEVTFKHCYKDEIYNSEEMNIFQLIELAESLVGDTFSNIEEAMECIKYIKETGEELWTATNSQGNLYDIKIFNEEENSRYLNRKKYKEGIDVIKDINDFISCVKN